MTVPLPTIPDAVRADPARLYLYLRQQVNIGRASWNYDHRIDIVPDASTEGVEHLVRVIVRVIDYRDEHFLVRTPREDEHGGGAAEVDTGEGTLPRSLGEHLHYTRIALALIPRNTWARIRHTWRRVLTLGVPQ